MTALEVVAPTDTASRQGKWKRLARRALTRSITFFIGRVSFWLAIMIAFLLLTLNLPDTQYEKLMRGLEALGRSRLLG